MLRDKRTRPKSNGLLTRIDQPRREDLRTVRHRPEQHIHGLGSPCGVINGPRASLMRSLANESGVAWEDQPEWAKRAAS